jgi:hypothetical protein
VALPSSEGWAEAAGSVRSFPNSVADSRRGLKTVEDSVSLPCSRGSTESARPVATLANLAAVWRRRRESVRRLVRLVPHGNPWAIDPGRIRTYNPSVKQPRLWVTLSCFLMPLPRTNGQRSLSPGRVPVSRSAIRETRAALIGAAPGVECNSLEALSFFRSTRP